HLDLCAADELLGRWQAVRRPPCRRRRPVEYRCAEGDAGTPHPRGRLVALCVRIGLRLMRRRARQRVRLHQEIGSSDVVRALRQPPRALLSVMAHPEEAAQRRSQGCTALIQLIIATLLVFGVGIARADDAPTRADIWTLKLGTPTSALSSDAFVDYACGSN